MSPVPSLCSSLSPHLSLSPQGPPALVGGTQMGPPSPCDTALCPTAVPGLWGHLQHLHRGWGVPILQPPRMGTWGMEHPGSPWGQRRGNGDIFKVFLLVNKLYFSPALGVLAQSCTQGTHCGDNQGPQLGPEGRKSVTFFLSLQLSHRGLTTALRSPRGLFSHFPTFLLYLSSMATPSVTALGTALAPLSPHQPCHGFTRATVPLPAQPRLLSGVTDTCGFSVL